MAVVTSSEWLQTVPWIDRPDADVDAYVRALADDPGFDLREKLDTWRRDGIVVFENAVDRDAIDRFYADVEYLKDHFADSDVGVEVAGVHRPIKECTRVELDLPGTKFHHLHTVSGSAVQLSLNKAVVPFLGHVFQSAPCVLQSLTFYRGSQQSIHIDYPYVRTQTMLGHLAASWIPLEDIHPDSGPLQYYPGSHHIDTSGFFDWGGGSILYEPDSVKHPAEFSSYLRGRMKEAGVEPRVFLPRKGDVLIWHGNLAHEGSHIAEPTRTRRSYVTHYTSLDAYPPRHRFPDAFESGRYVALNGGYCFDWPWVTTTRRLPSYDAVR